MAGKGQHYAPERRFMRDEITGAEIIRLSGFPTINHHTYIHARCFTPDSKTVIFWSYRSLERGAPRDLFRVDVDGLNLCQLTDCDGISWAHASPVDRRVFFTVGRELRTVDVDSFEEEVIGFSPIDVGSLRGGSISGDGSTYIAPQSTGDGKCAIVKFYTDGREPEVIYEHPRILGHLQYEPANSKAMIFFASHTENWGVIWRLEADGTDPRVVYERRYGWASHFMWQPGTDYVIATLVGPNRGLIRIDSNGLQEAQVISRLEAYWHAGISYNGKWACSDTFPDNGLFLVELETGKSRLLCLSKSSNAHPQWSHPHPCWSPDNSMVLFTSDWGGLPQVYLAKIPEEMLVF